LKHILTKFSFLDRSSGR